MIISLERRIRSLLIVVFIACPHLTLGAQGTDDLLSHYRLGSGDLISIDVLGEEELKREKVRLTDAGTIQYPVLGEIRIKGMTLGELEQFITSGLKGRYLVNPRVAVSIDEYRPFFISGEVNRPGSYPYAPGLTVLKAVSIAGGFKDRAAKNKIYVIHDDMPNAKRTKVQLDAAIYPGDILTIDESFF